MLGAVPLVVNLPIGSEEKFLGVFDLVAMKSIVWTGEVNPWPAPPSSCITVLQLVNT